MINRIPVAFAVTYLIGVVGAAWFLAQLAPRLMGINLEDECHRFEQQMQGGSGTRRHAARRDIEYRAYVLLPGSPLVGQHVRELEQRVKDARLFVERIRRGDEILDRDETTTVLAGDTLAITGRRELVVTAMDEQALGSPRSRRPGTARYPCGGAGRGRDRCGHRRALDCRSGRRGCRAQRVPAAHHARRDAGANSSRHRWSTAATS